MHEKDLCIAETREKFRTSPSSCFVNGTARKEDDIPFPSHGQRFSALPFSRHHTTKQALHEATGDIDRLTDNVFPPLRPEDFKNFEETHMINFSNDIPTTPLETTERPSQSLRKTCYPSTSSQSLSSSSFSRKRNHSLSRGTFQDTWRTPLLPFSDWRQMNGRAFSQAASLHLHDEGSRSHHVPASFVPDIDGLRAMHHAQFSHLVAALRDNPHHRENVCRTRIINLYERKHAQNTIGGSARTEMIWIVGAPWALKSLDPRTTDTSVHDPYPAPHASNTPSWPGRIVRVPGPLFLAAIFHAWGKDLVAEALSVLRTRFPQLTAERTLSPQQKRLCLFLGIPFLALSLIAPVTTWLAASALATIIFAFVILTRLLGLRTRQRRPLRIPLSDAALPVYTVLVPLYRETAVIDQLLAALSALDYPRDKLDAKLVIEASDQSMIEALQRRILPPWLEVITVPDIGPRTKPKALTYALQFARGDYVTVFDAEDIPDPRQLRLAAETFAAAPASVACLQARLGWYNAQESFFSRMLALDYAAHFEVILPWLSTHGWPLPLGGTSNHFRVEALKTAGGWDPCNVTEDADLGLRLARFGWRALMLPSYTMEEACISWRAWKAQRARWLKGWLQTWLVHTRALGQLRKQGGLGACFVLHGIIGTGVLSALLHPICLAVLVCSALHDGALTLNPQHPFTLFALIVLAGGYGLGIITAAVGLHRSGQRHLTPWLALLPVYWLMISAAAWLAVWDLLRRPHHWRKTAHGLSRHSRARNRALAGLWARDYRNRLHPTPQTHPASQRPTGNSQNSPASPPKHLG